MYVSVINVLVLTATGVLGSNVKYPKLNLCPPNANCYNVILCPGAIEKFKKGTPPIICGWVRDIPKVCCTNTATQINNLLNATTEEPRSRSTDSFRLSSISETGCGKRYSLPPALTMGGGDNDSKWRWPWMVTIFNAKGGTYLCGATLIDDRHILTAANCFDGKSLNPEDYSVEIGQTILKTPINPYRIQEIVLHEDYTPFLNNDIAIIRLDEPVKNVSDAVCILEDDNLEEGKLVTLLGWGQLSLSKRTPDRLQVVAGIPVVENRACSAIYKNKNAIYKMKFITNSAFPNGITEDLMCAGREKGGSDACQGDSGGPLLYEFEPDQFALVGIVSFGYQCVQPNSPGVYTRVSYFLPWITQYIESQTQFQLDPRRRPSRVG